MKLSCNKTLAFDVQFNHYEEILDYLLDHFREKWGCGGAIMSWFSNRGYMDSPTSTTGGHGLGTV